MAEGDDPRDPTAASGMPVPPPWPVVDKRSTYQRPPDYTGVSPAPSYQSPATQPPGRTGGSRRWLVLALVVVVLLALILWLVLR